MTLSAAIRAAIVAHAIEERPHECCGLLAGRDGVVEARYPLVNALASATAYSADVVSLFHAFKQIRAAGQELLAIYHSHPTSEPVPSRRDIEEWHYRDCVMIIIGADDTIRAWQIDDAVRETIIA